MALASDLCHHRWQHRRDAWQFQTTGSLGKNPFVDRHVHRGCKTIGLVMLGLD
jgi:hypothetical protein